MSGISTTHFGDEESDESHHSSHPMVTSGSSQSRSGGKAKLSTIKSSKKSPKKNSGYSGASLDDSQDGL